MRTTKGNQYRRSRQRERILELLTGTNAHPTANWLYDRLRKEFPNLSLGTVYRNLGVLVEQGLISRIGFGGTFDRFDANMEHHYHFICDICGTIIDLALPVDESFNRRIRGALGFEARWHDIQFRGTCEKCARKMK